MNKQLVKMSGQFWKVQTDGSQNIILVSTILNIQSKMTIETFTNRIVMGTIQPCGGI